MHSQFEIPPWHMWGGTQPLNFSAAQGGGTTQQIARVDFPRPESWKFFFSAEITGVSAPPAAQCDILVQFDLIIGIGRSTFNSQNNTNFINSLPIGLGFCEIGFRIPALTNPIDTQIVKKWTTTVPTPPLDDTNVTTSKQLIDSFPAQNITCFGRVRQSTGGPNIGLNMLLTAYFAPRTHVREEWFPPPAQQFQQAPAFGGVYGRDDSEEEDY